MSRYVLDADLLIDFSKGWQPTTARLLALVDAREVVAICDITVAEFYAGHAPGADPQLDAFIQLLPYWPTSLAAAIRAGDIRCQHKRRGTTISTTDAIITAIALAHGATVLTGNRDHFPLPELSVRSLRAEQEAA